ncbi:MAG TPA: GFA family protein [Rhizomicrobium sp.]
MKIAGGCHCGAIAYEAEVDPEMVGICHCTDCQTLSGSPYRVTLPTPTQNFRLLRGAPKVYVKTADSGTPRAQAFCADCGTPLYASAPQNPPTVSLRWGAIRQRAQLPPRRQIWCTSAAPFARDLGGIPSVDGQS